MVRVAINGFGRIGRCLFRFLWEMPDVGEKQGRRMIQTDWRVHLSQTAATTLLPCRGRFYHCRVAV